MPSVDESKRGKESKKLRVMEPHEMARLLYSVTWLIPSKHALEAWIPDANNASRRDRSLYLLPLVNAESVFSVQSWSMSTIHGFVWSWSSKR